MNMRKPTLMLALFILFLTAGTAVAGIEPEPFWPGEFIFESSNPATPYIHVKFHPPEPGHPPDPGLDLRNPLMPVISVMDTTNPTFQLLFAMEGRSFDTGVFPYWRTTQSVPDATGHYAFEVYDRNTLATLFDVSFYLNTSSGGVPDSRTWSPFDVIAEPGKLAFGFDFDFTSMSDERLAFQVTDGVSGAPMRLSVVPEPISATLFIVGGVTLGFRRFMRRKTA